jgi:hypothetical protein
MSHLQIVQNGHNSSEDLEIQCFSPPDKQREADPWGYHNLSSLNRQTDSTVLVSILAAGVAQRPAQWTLGEHILGQRGDELTELHEDRLGLPFHFTRALP